MKEVLKNSVKEQCCGSFFLASQRRSLIVHGADHSELDSQETRFLTDLYMLIMASSQTDVFGRDWLSVAVRVHWLKARHLAFLVTHTEVVLMLAFVLTFA